MLVYKQKKTIVTIIIYTQYFSSNNITYTLYLEADIIEILKTKRLLLNLSFNQFRNKRLGIIEDT